MTSRKSRYCFEEEHRYDLFTETAVRAVLAAARDFPRFVSRDESIARAAALCDVLQHETCCINKRNLGLYRQMVKSNYVSVYKSLQTSLSEREFIARMAFLKGLEDDEA